MKVTIVGGGNIGTQFAVHFAEKDHDVYIRTSKPSCFSSVLSIVNHNGDVIHQGKIKKATSSDKEAFAINNYDSKNWDAPYNSGLKKKVKEANIKNTKIVVDNEIHNSMYKTKVKDEIDDSFSNFHSLVKKDLKDFSLNGNEVLLSKDGSTVTISLQIPTRQYLNGTTEYLRL